MIPLTTSASCLTMSDADDVGKIVERKDDGMAKKTQKPNQKMQTWIEARKRHHSSHAQVQMARELVNPAKLGKIGWLWTARQRVKLHYVDGKKSPANPSAPLGCWPAACYIPRFPTAIVSGA